jgi:hypothetical protein
MKTHGVLRWIAAATLSLGVGARAENESFTEVLVLPSDRAAVNASDRALQHAQPRAGSTAEQKASLRQVDRSRLAGQLPHADSSGGSGRQDPGDLQYHGGPVLPTLVHHTIFVNPSSSCPPNSCFGDPIGFLRDLNRSGFVHVTDQYVGTHANDRYPVGNNFVVNYPVGSAPLIDADMETIAYAVAKASHQSGYGHIFHVFLVPGQDVCFDSTFQVCASNIFCAYHSSFDADIGHVIYSVEPFANVLGCQVPPGTPNGQLVDSTDSVLSHESIEAITDPDGNAWWNSHNLINFGAEIGDECEFISFTPAGVFFDPVTVRLNGTPYAIQTEYSNQGHACLSGRAND